MDGGDGGHAGVGGPLDHEVLSRLMLKFRPIAPKPVVDGESAQAGGSETTSELKSLPAGKVKLPKRKYVRRSKNNTKRRSTKRIGGDAGSPEKLNTLRLLPEKAEKDPRVDKESLTSSTISVKRERPTLSMINSTNGIGEPERSCNMQLPEVSSLAPFSPYGSNRDMTGQAAHFGLYFPDQQPSEFSSDTMSLNWQLLLQPPDRPTMVHVSGDSRFTEMAVVETVMVDCSGSTDPQELGGTDTEIIKNLGLVDDMSPGFLSDSSNKIRWVNGAFRRMVAAVEGQSQPLLLQPEAAVVLVVKDELPKWTRAFSGRVRVKLMPQDPHQHGHDKKSSSPEKSRHYKWQQVVPCDVWRMDCGGFAWRLDLKAALTLGRLS